MKRVKITVLRKEFYPELAETYLTDGREAGPCSILDVGDVFYYNGGAEMPNGFCPWAWIDLYRSINSLAIGASFAPWQKRGNVTINCCTDGVRPVVFHIEALEPVAEESL